MNKKIFFTDFFNISQETLDNYGALNISLLNDLPLFIDPFLIFSSEKAEYQKLHEEIIKYMIFLRDNAVKNPHPNKSMMKLYYTFPEVKQNYLGFCVDGNSGRGLGEDFALAMHSGLKDIFSNFGDEKITKSTHIEKLCLIKPKVGKDNISDFVTNLIKEYLLEYTQKFARNYIDSKLCKEFCVSNVFFDYKFKRWLPKKYYLPFYNNDFVLLSPVDLLVKDDTWINKKDFYYNFESFSTSIDNEALRHSVNEYFKNFLTQDSKRKDKIKAAQKTIDKYPQLIDYYIRYKEEHSDDAYRCNKKDVDAVKNIFVDQLNEMVNLLETKTKFYTVPQNSFEEALERTNYLKHVIEDKDGYRIFYDKDKPIRRESDLHILYKLACFDTACNIDAEVNNGRGPVDFKASNSSKDTTIIEFKLVRTLKKNLLKQVDVYKDANNTDKAIIVIVFYTDDEKEKLDEILDDLGLTNKPGIVTIDARPNKIQASKA